MKSIEELQDLVRNVKTVIFDSDGVLVEEGEPIEGAVDLIDYLHEIDKNVIVLSNNSTKHPRDMKDNYHNKGLKVDHIINSAMVTAKYCVKNSIKRVYIVGEAGLIEVFQDQKITYSTENVDAVIVGMDRDLTYDKLAIATRLIRSGVLFLGTNPDPSFPTPRGLEPGAGSMISALETSTGQKVDLVLGKPSIHGYEMLFEIFNVTNSECMMIGDRFETDIVGAINAEVPAIVVNTGIAKTRKDPGVFEDYPEVPVIQNLIELIPN